MEKLRIAVIGAGMWGMNHGRIYQEHPQAEIAGVCDLDAKKAKAFADTFGLGPDRVFTNHIEMLKNIKCDAVAIVTPDYLHRDLAVDCANLKKHILLEKPLATTREDVKDIVEAVEKNKVRIMVDLHNRWSPPFAITKKAIEDGEIGEVYSAYFRLNDVKSVATTMLSWAAQSSILWFLGSHSLDTLRWIFDDEVDTVYSVSRKGILSAQGINVEDIYQTILTFKKGGIATMENGWITPDTFPCVNDIKFNVTGTKGMFNLDLSNSQMIERFTEKVSDRPDVLVRHFVHGTPKGFSYESIRHFVDRILDGKDFLVSLEDAANTSIAILAIMESAETRQPVKVDYSL